MAETRAPSPDREAKFGGPPPPRTLAQRWVLATQGVLTEMNTTSHLRVGGEPRPSHSGLSAFRLRQHWGVHSPREARERIQWLLDEGHRFAFAKDSELPTSDFLAWDLVRASCVAGWSYVAYHLDLEEVWTAMCASARALRAAFGSWREVGASYAAGRAQWSGGSAADVEEVMGRLLAPGGGWDLPWDVDLDGDLPPPALEALPELVVDPAGGEGVFSTITDALDSTEAPVRVRVRAGVYDESVRIESPVELVAEGEVVVKNGEGAPLVVDHHAFVRGFHLVAGHDDEGNTMQAAWVGDNFARLVDCTLETERCGVYAGKKGAEVIVERCTAKEPGIHGFLIEGGAHMTLLASAVESAKGSGVMTQGDGELHAEGLRVVGATTAALTFNGANAIELHDVTVEDCAAHGMQVLGACVLEAHDVTIRNNKGAGVLFATKDAQYSAIHGGTITGNAGNDVGVLSGGASVSAVSIGSGPACAVCVQNDGRLQLEGCTIAPTVYPSLWLMGSSLTVLVDCTIRNDGELAVFSDKGSRVRLVGCDIETAKKSAVVLRGVAQSLILGGRIASPDECVHADGGSKVEVRDAVLIARGIGEEASPALASIEGADVACIGGRIEAAGGQAIVVEGGARAAFTRVAVAAPAGTAFLVDSGEVRVLGGEVTAKLAAKVEGDGSLRAEPAGYLGEGKSLGPLALDASALAPFEVVLVHHGRAAITIVDDALRPALAPLDAEPNAQLTAEWLGLALADQKTNVGFVIGRLGDDATVETEDHADLRAIAAHLKAVLGDPKRLEALAASLREQADSDDDNDDDDDDHDDDDHDDHDHDDDEN